MGRRRWICLALAVGAIGAGLVWRLVPLGLPTFWWKYGGSVLWAVMLYWLTAAGVRVRRVGWIVGVAFGLAVTVEMFKLVPGAELDVFRRTMAGKLLLGRVFSEWDLVAYGLGIGVMGAADLLCGRRRCLQGGG